MNPVFSLETAKGFLRMNEPDRALKELDDIPRSSPKDEEATRLRIRAYRAKGEPELAYDLGVEGICRHPDSPELHLATASAYRATSDQCGTAGAALALLETGPVELISRPLYHYQAARYSCALGRLDCARRSLARALHMKPSLRDSALAVADFKPLWTEIDDLMRD